MNKMTFYKTTAAKLACSAVLLLSACVAPPPPAPGPITLKPVCPQPTSKNLDSAIGEAKTMLSNRGCKGSMEKTYETLLTIGEGNPGAANHNKFEGFLAWAVDDMEYLSVKDAEVLFRRYFHSKFASFVDKNQNTCGICQDKKSYSEMLTEAANEIRFKQQGIEKVLGNPDRFNEINMHYIYWRDGLALVCDACQK